MKVLATALLLVALTAPVAAQEHAAPAPSRERAPELLPASHWARRALARLEAADLDDAWVDPGAGDLTAADAADAFETALARTAPDHTLRAIVELWRTRLGREYPAAQSRLGLDLGAGAVVHQNPVRARRFWINRDLGWEPPPPEAAPDTATALLAPRITAALGGRAWLEVEARIQDEDVALSDAYAATRLGNIGFWAGRRTTGFRTARGGGMVLDNRLPWDGGGVWFRDPVQLPGFLRHIGLFHAEGFLAVSDSNGYAPRPFLLATRFTVEPAPRFAVGVTRGILFGSKDGSRKIEWEEMPRILAGYAGEYVGDTTYYDNQVVAVDARWAPPLGLLPLQLYLTWGTEDTAGAWWDSPGIVGGLFVPFVPGAPALSLGVEHAVITSTGAHGSFYEHYRLIDGWTRDGVVLGHRLAGDGREWILYGDVAAAGFDAEWKLLRRFRSRGNLYGRPGRSHGAELTGRVRLAEQADLELSGFLEDGDGWSQGALSAAMRLRWQ